MSDNFNLRDHNIRSSNTNPQGNRKVKIPKINKSNLLRFLSIALIVIVLPITLILVKQNQDNRNYAAKSEEGESVKELSGFIMKEGRDSKNKDKFGKTSQIQSQKNIDAIQKSKDRKSIMLKLATENPEEFLLNALPAKVSDELLPLVKDNIEKEIKITGKVSVIHFDDFKGKKGKYVFQIKQLDKDNKEVKTYNLHFAKDIPYLETDSIVEIQGYVIGEEIVIPGGGGGGEDPGEDKGTGLYVQKYVNSNPIGNQKVLVIMFNFINDVSEPLNRDQLKNILVDSPISLSKYVFETSGGKTSLTVDYAGYFKIPYDNFECNNFDMWSTSADSIAFANGIDVTSYPRRIYVFPSKDNCGASAWATLGGVPSKSWMVGRPEPGVYNHEFGHNLGLMHANSYDCGLNTISFDENGFPNCQHAEYGDPTDVMGYDVYGNNSFQFNGPHKEALNYIDASQVITANETGNYSISSIETKSSAPKLIKIPIPSNDDYYYISLRNAIGLDTAMYQGITKGVSMHLWRKGGLLYDNDILGTRILDNTPESANYINDFTNSSLTDGQTFEDNSNGIKIQQISHSADQVNLQITLDKSICRRQVPEVGISPLSQVGSAGQELKYTLTIRNNDTTSCGPSNFTFYSTAIGPMNSNWMTKFNPTLLPLAPGEQKNVDIMVRSSGDSQLGLYTIQTSVSSENIRHNVRVKSSYIVFGNLSHININPSEVNAKMGSSIGLSALAYDNNNLPINSGVNYEWSMSSTNSVGTLESTTGIINKFIPLRSGFGELTIKGTFNNDVVYKKVPVRVLTPIPSLTPVPTTKKVTLISNADSFVRSTEPAKNFGILTSLQNDLAPDEIAFIRFNLSSLAGKTIKSAKLVLTVSDPTNSSLNLRIAEDKDWSETGITYNNKPRFVSTVTTFNAKTQGSKVTLGVKNVVNNKKGTRVIFGVKAASDDSGAFHSRQAATATNRPQLIVEYQ